MSKMKKLLWVLIPLLLVGHFAWKKHHNRPAPVYPKRADIVEAVYGLGTVTAYKEYNARFAIPIGIRDIMAKEGQEVKKDAPLFVTDEGVVVRAPFQGTVTHINHNIGETIFPQVPIVTLVDLKDLYIVVSLEQQGALKVRPGLSAKLSFESLGGGAFEGVVKSVLPLKDQFLAHLEVKDLPSQILPGMSADVAIVVGQKAQALLVPRGAVANGSLLVKRSNKKIEKLMLKTGLSDGQYVEVISPDLSLDEEIVMGDKK